MNWIVFLSIFYQWNGNSLYWGLVYIYISLIKFDQLSTMGVNKGQ